MGSPARLLRRRVGLDAVEGVVLPAPFAEGLRHGFGRVGRWSPIMRRFVAIPVAVSLMALGAVLAAQAQPPPSRQADRPENTDPAATFRSGVTLMTTVVIPRDRDGFLADLGADDFLVFGDDRPQQVVSLVRVLGGRVGGQLAPPRRLPGGVVLPPPAPPRTGEAGGRLFVILVDDLNIEEALTLRTRAVFEQLAENVIREGDLFGIVSTGPSSIAIDLTSDRRLLETAAARITGAGFRPDELVENFPPDDLGVPELMVRARLAFNTMRNIVGSLERVRQRRKVVIYLSGGYDFNPFPEARASYFRGYSVGRPIVLNAPGLRDAASDRELTMAIAELATAANRANASFYTVDPRGLVAGPGAAEFRLTGTRSFNDWIFTTQNSLRSIAEQTGGRAVVNRNDFDDAFREIDAETSDYYILGFALDDADSTVRTRRLRVEVRGRDDVDVRHRSEYTYGETGENRPPL